MPVSTEDSLWLGLKNLVISIQGLMSVNDTYEKYF